MDLNLTDPRSLDVAYDISKLSFRFYTDKEALRLSVRRLTSPHAFDEIGRPIQRGLYDIALGPTTINDGPCITCGLSYTTCPGHFGHIELPIPLPHPLLKDVHLKLLRSTCWYCNCIRKPKSDLDLFLAALYFEDADLPACAVAVNSYRGLRKKQNTSNPNIGEKDLPTHPLVKNWKQFLRSMPKPVSKYVGDIDPSDIDLIEKNMLLAARVAWNRARSRKKLAKTRSEGWDEIANTVFSNSIQRCPECYREPTKVRKGDRGRLFRSSTSGEILLSPTEIQGHVKAVWDEHEELFELLYGLKGRETADNEDSPGHLRLFVKIVLVPPSRFRPTSLVGDMSYAAEHPQNLFFQRLLAEIDIIIKGNKYGLDGEAPPDDENLSEEESPIVNRPSKTRFVQAVTNMQEALRDLYDSSGMASAGGAVQMTGIRQQLEAKAGLFRQHMMGKRVNYSCRSVIGPDVFLDTNEIGIPESFARQLTIPEPVTPANLEEMRRAVLNGPDIYPGATAVEDYNNAGDRRIVKFTSSSKKRMLTAQADLLLQNFMPNGVGQSSSYPSSQANGDDPSSNIEKNNEMPKRVYRHLRNGDVVLFNRQPTLHRVSIMAHKVRVLPGDRTIRFHYTNCGSYNADFDGDEMNVHVPQDYLSRAEAEELMLSSRHYIVPTSGAPIRGLIQDHIAAATLLSRRNTFLDRETFIQLLYSATERVMQRSNMIEKRYILPEPAVLKPVPLWTGKQLISTVLYIIRNGRPGLNLEAGTKTKASVVGLEESRIIIQQGQLLQGVIDKSSLGSSMYGVVHAIQEVYGCDASDDFLSCIGRLCLYYMRKHGHTTGVDDLLIRNPGEKKRSEILEKCYKNLGVEVTNEVYRNMNSQGEESKRKAANFTEARNMIEEMIRKDGIEAEDRLDAAMTSALGKVASNVMNECVPKQLCKSFPSNGFALMTNTGAKGSAVNSAQISCLLGSTKLEGKRVPRMGGSGATLPCFHPFDASPLAGGFISSRFLTGISPQEFFFHAMSGREGLLDTSLKTANSGYLQRCLIKHLEGVRLHYDGTVRDSDSSVLQFIYGDDGIDPSKSRWLNDKLHWQVSNQNCLETSKEPVSSLVTRAREEMPSTVPNHKSTQTLLEKVSPGALALRGAISEKFNDCIEKVVQKEGDNQSKTRKFLEGRYQAAALEPGEAVGVVAAQGVGEPSTQMTLNTFHHAGSSSAHVTMGIPRLRELLMTASKYPKTPSMTLPLFGDKQKEKAAALRKRLQNVCILDLLVNLKVTEMASKFSGFLTNDAVKSIRLEMHFPPEKLYAEELGFGFRRIQVAVAKEFLPVLHNRIKREVARIISENKEKYKHSSLSTYLKAAVKPNLNDDLDLDGLEDSENIDDIAEAGSPVSEDPNTSDSDGENSSSGEEKDDDSDEDDEGETEKNIIEEQKNAAKTEDKPVNEKIAIKEKNKKEKEKKKEKKKKEKKQKKKKRKEVSTESKKQTTVRDVEVVQYGGLGYVNFSLGDEDDDCIFFDWSLPVAMVGRLHIGSIMKETAAGVKLAHVERITKCFLDTKMDKHSVVTEGSNTSAIFQIGYGLVDFNRVETNDMYGILNTYGVEAMRAALIKEFVKVFEAYGIPVNIRHLRLIADYMTADGSYRGFNRAGIDSTPSPFQKMTFETSVKFLTKAALNSTDEFVQGPSAAIALGQVYEGGTGSFQLLQQVN